jgi:hypothetical protein
MGDEKSKYEIEIETKAKLDAVHATNKALGETHAAVGKLNGELAKTGKATGGGTISGILGGIGGSAVNLFGLGEVKHVITGAQELAKEGELTTRQMTHVVSGAAGAVFAIGGGFEEFIDEGRIGCV